MPTSLYTISGAQVHFEYTRLAFFHPPLGQPTIPSSVKQPLGATCEKMPHVRKCVGLVWGGGSGAGTAGGRESADSGAVQLKGTVARNRPEWEQKVASR